MFGLGITQLPPPLLASCLRCKGREAVADLTLAPLVPVSHVERYRSLVFPHWDGHQVPQPFKLPMGVTIATFEVAEGALDACLAISAAALPSAAPAAEFLHNFAHEFTGAGSALR